MDPEYQAVLMGRALDKDAAERRRAYAPKPRNEPVDEQEARRRRRLERIQTRIRAADHMAIRQTRLFLGLSWPEFWHYVQLVIARHIQEEGNP